VGHPGETEADFQATLALVREVRFAQAFSFKYSPRPGTPAAGAFLEMTIIDRSEVVTEWLEFGIRALTTTRDVGSFGLMTDEPVNVVMSRWYDLRRELSPGGDRLATAGQVHGNTVLVHHAGWQGWLRSDAADGHVRLIRDVADLDACLAGDALGVVFHFEGAEPIDTDLDALDVWHAAGLRSLGIVWSRANDFASGVPFKFPSTPDTGPGLTEAGRRLVKRCAELGIAVDLSHLNAAGFWDVARIDGAPLIASHSGVYELCTYSRNLMDDQLDAIAASGGLVGINFDVGSLRADGGDDADTPLSRIAEHARYVADRCGVDHVALGSDFDGATMPADVPHAGAYQGVLAALEAAGFANHEVDQIAWGNWRRVIAAAWG